MAKLNKAQHKGCSLVVLLDNLKDADFHPVLDLFMEIDASEIDAVDIINRSACPLDGGYVLSLLRAINTKLRIVDLQDVSLGKNFLLNISQRGLRCQVLNLKSSHFRKLNMCGSFEQMHTLNLDFSTSLSGFREDCFLCMPNLKFLSLCETRIMNLWTTSAALIKLPSLVELRFQYYLNCDGKELCSSAGNFLCCNEEVSYSAFSRPENGKQVISTQDLRNLSGIAQLEVSVLNGELNSFLDLNMEEETMNFYPDSQTTSEDLSDCEVDFSPHRQVTNSASFISNAPLGFDEFINLQTEIFNSNSMELDEVEFPATAPAVRHKPSFPPKMSVSYHSSPICYEKYYREFILASLPTLKILDNLPVSHRDRNRANDIVADHFECLPYRRKINNVIKILHDREIKESRSLKVTRRANLACSSGKSQYSYSRSLSAAKMGSSAWPAVQSLSISGRKLLDDNKSFRPRQFEYHPSDPSVMVIGTLDGEVIVINHESGKIISYIPSFGAMHSVLGLCWLKRYPSKLIAGSDNGSLRLYDILHTSQTTTGFHPGSGFITFNDFDQLTSVHVNSTDELFLASGYSRDVVLYDINSGRRLQVFSNMHREHINVVKFSNHSPSMFATSSFDQDVKMWDLRQTPHQPCYTASSSRGNVMVCFSPDDNYLLVSAVDNEVKQLLAADGRLHLDFAIASTGSSQNYTRSYYMNGKDYVISGSCDENVVRICCAQTGRRLKDVSLEGKGSRASMFVQSLRGDPFKDFNMGILAAYMRPCANSEIVKVNLLTSQDCVKELSCNRREQPLFGTGG